jgi:hypothetical protein
MKKPKDEFSYRKTGPSKPLTSQQGIDPAGCEERAIAIRAPCHEFDDLIIHTQHIAERGQVSQLEKKICAIQPTHSLTASVRVKEMHIKPQHDNIKNTKVIKIKNKKKSL